mmetsp:Transcript_103419/g.200398  ORF Transcript_103419/g.200398 Transcript_103419/m.200398 type:complete len:84 (-) Transcript_103419:560-811(-)
MAMMRLTSSRSSQVRKYMKTLTPTSFRNQCHLWAQAIYQAVQMEMDVDMEPDGKTVSQSCQQAWPRPMPGKNMCRLPTDSNQT